ncbi:MAG: LD-carboxypeptidase, partial [Prevotellaceae bacterium]|nr:LD-carboxypeptidase [Prevotellaceae bacterium]
MANHHRFVQPAPLTAGDVVGICAPAGRVGSEAALRQAALRLEAWGLRVRLGSNVLAVHHQMAGTDKQRAADLQELLSAPDVRAILFARGGYGCARLLPAVDFSPLAKCPKWLAGYSDTTALHMALYRLGVASLHAAMPAKFADEQSVASLRSALFGEDISLPFAGSALNVQGEATGRLVGGNLSVSYSLQAT